MRRLFVVSIFLVGCTVGRVKSQPMPPEPPESLLDSVALGHTLPFEEASCDGYLNNLDSMLNLWYVQEAIDSAAVEEPMDLDSADIVAELPDSVYIRRLSQLNSLISLPFNRIVRNYINVYTQKKREQVSVMLGLTEYYFSIFDEVLDRYQLPMELRILPIIESALNPRAVSRVGATGLWQFMYSTGRRYNLQVDSYVDQRRDPIASTEAAARYLRDLYGIYHDWTLVIAAYNCGPGNVNKAIRRSGGKRGYWDIYYHLPRETRGYVPAFIAANYVMNYAQEHNIYAQSLPLPRTTDTVVVHGRLHLKQVSHSLGVPMQQLRDLNPQYKHDLLPSRKMNILRLPLEHIGEFIDKEGAIRAYKDSIYLNPKQIREPVHYAGDYYVPEGAKRIRYKVCPGDVLGVIAENFHVRVSDIRRWNHIRGSRIRAGQTLYIYKRKR